MNQLLYRLEIVSSSINFKLFINEVPIIVERKYMDFSIRLNINQWLMNTGNVLRIEVIPPNEGFKNSSYIKIRLGTSPLQELKFNEVFKIQKNLSVSPSKQIIHPFVTNPLPFTKTVSELPSIDITNKKVYTSLHNKYLELYQSFQRKDKKSILDLCMFRIREYEKVHFLAENTEYKDFNNLLETVFNEEIMARFIKEKLYFHLYAGNKIARI